MQNANRLRNLACSYLVLLTPLNVNSSFAIHNILILIFRLCIIPGTSAEFSK